ncbi:MAG: hypothetical protein KF708_15895 [Pirellulales bacterium]|nr:hypothetical protein [Pirellulales bacterium]
MSIVADGRRIDVDEYRELIVSRRPLIRTTTSRDDLLALRDTATGETFVMDADLVFSERS